MRRLGYRVSESRGRRERERSGFPPQGAGTRRAKAEVDHRGRKPGTEQSPAVEQLRADSSSQWQNRLTCRLGRLDDISCIDVSSGTQDLIGAWSSCKKQRDW